MDEIKDLTANDWAKIERWAALRDGETCRDIDILNNVRRVLNRRGEFSQSVAEGIVRSARRFIKE